MENNFSQYRDDSDSNNQYQELFMEQLQNDKEAMPDSISNLNNSSLVQKDTNI